MDYELVSEPEKIIMGIAIKTSNEQGKGEVDIPNLWDRFFKEEIKDKIPNKASDEVYALYTEYEGDHTKPYTCLIGCEVTTTTETPPGLKFKTVPSAQYAKISVKGEHPQSLIAAWSKIWESSLTRTFTGDFELYGKKFHNDPPELEIYVAVSQ